MAKKAKKAKATKKKGPARATKQKLSKGATKIARATKARAKQPKQIALIEDARNVTLEKKAIEYAEVRDARISLSAQEVTKLAAVTKEIKRLGKVHYRHGNVEIALTLEKEKTKVKIHSDKGAADALPAEQPEHADVDGDAGAQATE